MGKKRPQEGEPKPENDSTPAQAGIFNTLFGSAQVESAAVSSIFSDDNPFRRKATEPKSEDSEIREEKQCNFDSVFLSKKGKDEEEEAGAGSVATKRSKKEKTENPNSGSDANGEGGENRKLGDELNKEKVSDFDLKFGGSSDSDKRKTKKRKRDEIEKEYEEKKYGVLLENKGEKEKKSKVGEKRKKADDSAESMVSKEGFDDENKLLRTVFVGNLPLKVRKKTILKEFSKFGEVESLRIRSVPIVDTKKTRKGAIMQKQINENASSVHAYVVFKTEQSVEASLGHNMSQVGGNHIRVDRACPPRKKLKGLSVPLYDPKRTIFVGNLPFDVKDEELYQLFTSINNLEGAIEGVRVVRDPHVNVGKGIAYVLFKTREAANWVIKKGSLKLRNRELRLSHTKSDSTPSKRKNPSSSSNPNSPAKKLATGKITSSGAKNSNLPNRKSSLSYQGLRATKSDSNKKRVNQKSPGSAKAKPRKGIKQEKPKERQYKRPAVAARKAKAAALMESRMKQAGNKRKLDGSAPGSFRQKKKSKRF